ncbi:MAG: hypothetical protein QGG02_07385 [Gammaproteobacteria bacterium]|jgi:hypothetical protein|nr:hypothetical protein [Gammaproteobacteria bacterium]MDP6732527.1 hypothetical protein [Gammaproteobacteria bacterium]
MKTLSITFGLILLLTTSPLLTAQSLSSQREQLQQSLVFLNDLEDAYGHSDYSLAEPLGQVADGYMVLGLYFDAHRSLDRAMQIVRRNEGLYTRAQLPYLQKKIENLANWGDWDSARTQLQHLFWLYRTKSQYADRQLVDDLMFLSNTHLRGITEDFGDRQSYHMRRAMSSNWMALAVGEAIWGTSDEHIAPLLYSLIKQYHLHTVAINWAGRTGYELRQAAPGADWVRKRSEMQNYYYYTGLRLLDQIRSIYAAVEPIDYEGLAMAKLYVADWQVLFGRDAEALESYQLAYQALELARVDAALVNDYFSQPSLLPEPRFYASLQAALSARQSDLQLAERDAPDDASNLLFFTEWDSAFPYVRRPSELSMGQLTNSNFALFSFSLAGVPDIQSFLNGLSDDPFSRVQDAELVETLADPPDTQHDLMRTLSWLRFRPKLDGGLPQQAAATLRYELAAETP